MELLVVAATDDDDTVVVEVVVGATGGGFSTRSIRAGLGARLMQSRSSEWRLNLEHSKCSGQLAL